MLCQHSKNSRRADRLGGHIDRNRRCLCSANPGSGLNRRGDLDRRIERRARPGGDLSGRLNRNGRVIPGANSGGSHLNNRGNRRRRGIGGARGADRLSGDTDGLGGANPPFRAAAVSSFRLLAAPADSLTLDISVFLLEG